MILPGQIKTNRAPGGEDGSVGQLSGWVIPAHSLPRPRLSACFRRTRTTTRTRTILQLTNFEPVELSAAGEVVRFDERLLRSQIGQDAQPIGRRNSAALPADLSRLPRRSRAERVDKMATLVAGFLPACASGQEACDQSSCSGPSPWCGAFDFVGHNRPPRAVGLPNEHLRATGQAATVPALNHFRRGGDVCDQRPRSRAGPAPFAGAVPARTRSGCGRDATAGPRRSCQQTSQMKIIITILVVVCSLLAAAGSIVVLGGALLPRRHRVSRSILLRAAPAQVYGLIDDFAAAPAWRADVKRVVILKSESGEVRFREFGAHGAVTYEVVTDVPNERLVTRIVDRDLGYSGSWEYPSFFSRGPNTTDNYRRR